MAMNRLMDYVRDINRKVGSTLTTEKAKSIRKKLIIWGGVVTLISAIILILSFVLMFSSFSVGDHSHTSFSVQKVFIGMGLMIGGGLLLSLGVTLLHSGLTIIIAGEGAKFLDTAFKCPNCGDPVEKDEIYCNKCGTDLRNKTKCSKCGAQNEVNDDFCRKCGNKLS